ncbi:Putative ribonuclease H protein At1g65750, partial [Linum perenne]
NASTAIGGVLRDDGSNFVKAFCANVENCSITRAELGNIVEGLKLAWSLGIRKVIVQSDSKVAISILQSVDRLTHKHTAIMADFQALRARDWEVSIPRIDREANRGDDYLANLGHSFCIGLHLFSFPDSSLAHWLRYDLNGVALPRAVSINNYGLYPAFFTQKKNKEHSESHNGLSY